MANEVSCDKVLSGWSTVNKDNRFFYKYKFFRSF
jgi:hypothetical protein